MPSAHSIIITGVVVGVVSSATQSLGLTLQRKANVACSESLYRNPTWQLGLALFLLANLVGSTVQIATLPLIILAPLQSCGLLFNSLASHYILQERSTWRTPLATLLIVGGGMVIGVAGVSATESQPLTHSLAELLALAHGQLFLRWFVATNFFVLLALVYARVYRPSTLARGLVYGCCSGVWSAHALLLAKSASDIITHALVHKSSDLRHLPFYVLVAAFVATSLTQLFLLNKGLSLISTSILYPLVFCVFNLINIFNGVLFFPQDKLTSLQMVFKLLPGVMSLITGVALLSRDQYMLSQRDEPLLAPDTSNRTSTLSYTSLRPRSMDLSSLQKMHSKPAENDGFYVSLPHDTKRDSNISAGSKKKGRRVLSFEQEGLLNQMV
ncbi:LAMI_0G14686g1_1 [Lachancea mirantina]|uniref:LAMI_0G14686g1_1 n=1 Tax=Lachancea mirantina TaxID=1230905 RepID=A0A1G4KC82_9SACH|nr:LAMI_0G14686g1_1 [Lachancea mirantina]